MSKHTHSNHQSEENSAKSNFRSGLNMLINIFGGIMITALVYMISSPLSFTGFDFINRRVNTDPNNDGVVRNYYIAELEEILADGEVKVTRKSENLEVPDEVIVTTSQADLSIYDQSGELTLHKGDQIVVQVTEFSGNRTYSIVDRFRLQSLTFILLMFVVVVIAFSFRKGISSLAALVLSLVILMTIIVPGIVYGYNPLLVSFIGGSLISILSIYMSHGFTKDSHLSVTSNIITIGIATVIAIFSVYLTSLMGNGNQDALFIQTLGLGNIDLRGVLLAGIIIGTLGILDDITTSQIAAVHELSIANKNYKFPELFKSAINIGRTHIASLINTLILAYAGTALPLFIVIGYNGMDPLWVILNSEAIGEELVRTVVGSIALIIAVPISTILAAWWFSREAK